MTARRWYGLDLRAPAGAVEFIIAALADFPVIGMEEDTEDPTRLAAFSATPWDVTRALEAARAAAAQAGEDPSAVAAVAFTVEDEDWLRVWKEGWRPTPLGERLVVLPAWWSEPVADGRAVVRIEPGRAFGTGTHVTTALAWELLEPAVAQARRLLDVGAGSGILSLGALRLSPGLRATLTEADPDALRSLRDNLALNHADGRADAILANSVPVAGGGFDLAAANLTAREHLVVDEGLHRALSPGGRLVLSGLREEQAAEASARWRTRAYVLEAEIHRDTWAAFRWRRP